MGGIVIRQRLPTCLRLAHSVGAGPAWSSGGAGQRPWLGWPAALTGEPHICLPNINFLKERSDHRGYVWLPGPCVPRPLSTVLPTVQTVWAWPGWSVGAHVQDRVSLGTPVEQERWWRWPRPLPGGEAPCGVGSAPAAQQRNDSTPTGPVEAPPLLRVTTPGSDPHPGSGPPKIRQPRLHPDQTHTDPYPKSD